METSYGNSWGTLKGTLAVSAGVGVASWLLLHLLLGLPVADVIEGALFAATLLNGVVATSCAQRIVVGDSFLSSRVLGFTVDRKPIHFVSAVRKGNGLFGAIIEFKDGSKFRVLGMDPPELENLRSDIARRSRADRCAGHSLT